MMVPLAASLVSATLLCALVAGLLFAFAVVIMPGIGTLEDREFLRAFQVVDGVIQRGQPLFGTVWMGSAIAVVIGMSIGAGHLEGPDRLMLVVAGLSYLLGVQLPTFVINIPMNNTLQALDLGSIDDGACRRARDAFERRWNRWNAVRTVVATVVTAALLTLLLRI